MSDGDDVYFDDDPSGETPVKVDSVAVKNGSGTTLLTPFKGKLLGASAADFSASDIGELSGRADGGTNVESAVDNPFANPIPGTENQVASAQSLTLCFGGPVACAAGITLTATGIYLATPAGQDALSEGVRAATNAVSGGATSSPGGFDPNDPSRNRKTNKVNDGPRFDNLRDHAARHGLPHQSTNQYYNAAVQHTRSAEGVFKVRHNGVTKVNYVTRTGTDSFTFTSGSRSGNRVFTHLYNVNQQYLRNKGITLPKGF